MGVCPSNLVSDLQIGHITSLNLSHIFTPDEYFVKSFSVSTAYFSIVTSLFLLEDLEHVKVQFPSHLDDMW